MTLAAIPIDDRALSELAALAKTQGKTAEQLIAELITRYLEDSEDVADALDALDDGEASVPLEQVKAELGL